jgi:hypothetical protein
MESKQNAYLLVQEADTIGLSEKEAMVYLKNSGESMDRVTYFKYKKRVKDRKQKMLFHVAQHLPDVHITQISTLQMVRKKLLLTFLALGKDVDPKVLGDLSSKIIEVERAISDYNGWTQTITEDTLAKFGVDSNEQEWPMEAPPWEN